MQKNPDQPIVFDADGTARFKANSIVVRMLRASHQEFEGILRSTSSMDDLLQFFQLLGYSVDGYCELDFMGDEAVARAQEQRSEAIRLAREFSIRVTQEDE